MGADRGGHRGGLPLGVGLADQITSSYKAKAHHYDPCYLGCLALRKNLSEIIFAKKREPKNPVPGPFSAQIRKVEARLGKLGKFIRKIRKKIGSLGKFGGEIRKVGGET